MAETSDTPHRASFWERVRARIPFRRRTPAVEPAAADRVRRRPGARVAALLVLALIVLWYPVGMVLTNDIRDDLNFGTTDLVVPPNASRAVAVSAALIAREVEDGPWVANDPFFMPGALLDNMPAFQQGIVQALARFTFELTDQIGRVRGSSRTDADLQEAAGL